MALLSLGFILCLSGVIVGVILANEWEMQPNGTYEYHVTDDFAEFTWHSGRDWCMENGGDVASIEDKYEMDFVMSVVNKSRDWDIYIGLNQLYSNDFTWIDGSTFEFRNWADGFPVEDTYGKHCAFVKRDTQGEWYNAYCGDEKQVVCKRKVGDSTPKTDPVTPHIIGYCPKDYIGVENKCFKIVQGDSGVTWDEAVATCQQNVAGGVMPDIASIHSAQQNALVTSQLQERQGGLWIGARYQAYQWYWVDNSQYDYNNFPSSYDGDCGMIDYAPVAGKWSAIDCSSIKGFVCQVFKDSSSPVETPQPTTPHSCQSGYTPYWYGCYKMVKEAQAWKDALLTCQGEGANLVSIHSEAENAAIFVQQSLSGTESIWIGLSKTQSTDEYIWSDGWYVLYTKWGDDQPSSPPDGGCVAIQSDGKWYDVMCDDAKPFVCKATDEMALTTPPSIEGQCPRVDGVSEWKELGGYCYYFSNEFGNSGSWLDAMESCKGFHSTSSLVSVHSIVENDWIYKQLDDDFLADNVWLGLYRHAGGNEFSWIDGSTVQFSHWAPGSPDGEEEGDNCILMDKDTYPSFWSDVSCDDNHGYVCKMPKQPVYTTPVAVPGSCPDSSWLAYGSNCFFLDPDQFMDWGTAHIDCLQRGGANASLAHIESIEENTFIEQKMLEHGQIPTHRPYWIGLSRKDENSPFLWTGGKVPLFYNWHSGQPDINRGHCVQVDMLTGTWSNVDCEGIFRGHVCKVAKVLVVTTPQVTTVSTTPSSGESESNNGSLSDGEVVAIVFGLVALACMVVGVTGLVLHHKRKQQEMQDTRGLTSHGSQYAQANGSLNTDYHI